MFHPNIKNKDIIRERYHCFRTWRKTSDTRDIDVGVNRTDIDVVNRWNEADGIKNKRSSAPMKHYYAQVEVLRGPFVRYTSAM